MDMADVIVLDDSSSASSDSEASPTQGPSSPAVRLREQPGYEDAVKTALALAASLEPASRPSSAAAPSGRAKPGHSGSSGRAWRSKSKTLPPLLAVKPRRPGSAGTRKNRGVDSYNRSEGLQQRRESSHVRDRIRQVGGVAVRRPAGENRRSTASGDGSRNDRREAAVGGGRVREGHVSGRSDGWDPVGRERGRRRTHGDLPGGKRRRSGFNLPVSARNEPAEVVDLRSSSSSASDSSSSRRSRSSSSSSTSSGSDSLPLTPAKGGKKRLVLNTRVSQGRPGPSNVSDLRDRRMASSGPYPVHSRADERVTEKERVRKPARMLSRKRRQHRHRGVDVDNATAIRSDLKKKQKAADEGLRDRESSPKQIAVPVSMSSSPSSSLASSSGVLSSPTSEPRRRSSQDQASGAAFASPSTADRPFCRKSASTGAIPSRRARSMSPLPSSPEVQPTPRKKRRVYSHFDTDRVPLDDLQAQERELAWIQSQHKQARSGLPVPKRVGQNPKASRKTATHLNEHLLANTRSAASSEDAAQCNHPQEQSKAKPPPKLGCKANVNFSDVVLHPTSYCGVFLDEGPLNVLQLDARVCSAPFVLDCDRPLTFYDETETLESQCQILDSFGKTKQIVASIFPNEPSASQADVTRSVSEVVEVHLPIVRSCHRRKIHVILAESRRKLSAYRTALEVQRSALRDRKVKLRRLPRSAAEQRAVSQLKNVSHSCSRIDGDVSFELGRGDGLLARNRTVSALIQVNRLEKLRGVGEYTTSIGLRSSFRAEDYPTTDYSKTATPSESDEEIIGRENCVQKQLVMTNEDVIDEEEAEYILRLVIARLGDSEQVFHALKSELGFAQAYTDYSELKKRHDSRQRTAARLERVNGLVQQRGRTVHYEVAALTQLMETSSLSSREKPIRKQLRPPINCFESNIAETLVDDAAAAIASMGLRATDDYDELAGVYSDALCRMCCKYDCHEHVGDNPLPIRRVDPTYPRLKSPPSALKSERREHEHPVCDELGLLEVVGKASGVASVYYSEGAIGDLERVDSGDSVLNGRLGLNAAAQSGPQLAEGESPSQHWRPSALSDASEYIDTSHVDLVARKMHSFLSAEDICGELCWKRGSSVAASKRGDSLPASVLGLVRKLRMTMGENSCLLAAVVGSASCIELHDYLATERVSANRAAEKEDGEKATRRMRMWKHSRRSLGSNHELVQWTRNDRLRDRGAKNHEYKPCNHDGPCDSGCSCMKRDHMCEKACACSRDCPNRFEGCTCLPGACHTQTCPCFKALRECDPDVCLSCDASEIATIFSDGSCKREAAKPTCGNVNVLRRNHEKLAMGFSDIHGWGVFAGSDIRCGDFVCEHTGALLSLDEHARRAKVYAKKEKIYVLELNEDTTVDALRTGNKSKFLNHDAENPNCTAKLVSVCGVHHSSIWALRDIAKGEELVFDYGYNGTVRPDWGQH